MKTPFDICKMCHDKAFPRSKWGRYETDRGAEACQGKVGWICPNGYGISVTSEFPSNWCRYKVEILMVMPNQEYPK